MMSALSKLYYRSIAFIKRQPKNFKLMLTRRAVHGLALGLSAQYNSIYATVLGASPVQFGSLQSVGNAIGALISLPAGWFIDRYSLKKTFLFSTALLLFSSVLFFSATHWGFLYAAIVLLRMGVRTTCTSCTVVGARELRNEERASGRGLCQTVSSVISMVAPLLAAWLISASGGMNRTGLQSLYIIQGILFVGIFILLLVVFKDLPVSKSDIRTKVLQDFTDIFKQGPVIIRFLLMIALMEIPWNMVNPFLPLYAHVTKGADEFIIGAIGTVRFLATFLFALPVGRLADHYGRKKILFCLAPLTYLSNILFILVPNANLLLLGSVFFGFYGIGTSVVNAMAAEFSPKERMGQWIGIASLVRGLVSIPMPLLSGLLWDHMGPIYIFIAAIVIDLVFRLPLLASIPETLKRETA